MNGIIINDELHELVVLETDPCDNCSLKDYCPEDMFLCAIIYGKYRRDDRFINRGKIKEIRYEKKEGKI